MATQAGSIPAKKRGPFFWVLIGAAVLVLLVGIAIAALAYFANAQMDRLGLDAETRRLYPRFVVVKVSVGLNPDAEILQEDKPGARILFRSKQTGKESISSVSPDGVFGTADYDPSVPFMPAQPGETGQKEKEK